GEGAGGVPHLVGPPVGGEDGLLLAGRAPVGGDGQDVLDALGQQLARLVGQAALPGGDFLRGDAVQGVQLLGRAAPSAGGRRALAQLGGGGQLQLGVVAVVEEGVQLVVLLLRQRVELVVVALGAADR